MSAQSTYGNSAIDDAQSEICSRCASKRVMLDCVQNGNRATRGCKQWRRRCSITIPRTLASVKLAGAQPQQSINTISRPPPLPRLPPCTFLFSAYTPRATIMADSMEGVVTEGEQPKTENVEQKAIAGK